MQLCRFHGTFIDNTVLVDNDTPDCYPTPSYLVLLGPFYSNDILLACLFESNCLLGSR
jgi:hypothetical protein